MKRLAAGYSRALALAALLGLGGTALAGLAPEKALEASRTAIGSQPRDYVFTDTDGRRVTLSSYRGKPLIVSLVYTACSQVCPTATRDLAKGVREARKVVGEDGFRVASIGFNVPYDNPMTMRVFARQNDISDPRWAFLTPEAGSVEALTRDFGFSYSPSAGGFEHVSQVTILDANGRVAAQLYGESFALPMLVQPLRGLALERPAGTVSELLQRVRLVCTVYDPLTGKYRLDYGLFIELAVGFACLALTLGYLVRERQRARRPC